MKRSRSWKAWNALCTAAAWVVMASGVCGAQHHPLVEVVPYPQQVQVGDGAFPLEHTFTVTLAGHREPRLERAVQRFQNNLTRVTGVVFYGPRAGSQPPGLSVRVEGPSAPVQKLGEDESYSLEVSGSSMELHAPTPLGALRGLETLLQLVRQGTNGFVFPAVSIKDAPRFPWRGLLIDSCRHWMPLEVIRRTLDGMAAVKMNVLHWHLSEDQGFRVESRRFPRLHQMGSDGLFYTQAEIREVIEYARDRGIRVVPEFDMPGHTTAWFVGHPELASAPGPYAIERKWGIFDNAMDPSQESTYKFLDTFIAEMAALFPDAYFHIGGDEVTDKQWMANARVREFMKAKGIKDAHALQAHFNQRLQKIVAKHGKIMMGWDEILHPELPKEIVVHSWRGQKSLAEAARQGIRGLLSSGYYLDLMYPAERHYAVDPLGAEAANLTDEEKARVLGGEACMWAEYISPETIDSRLWPRGAAVAERLWSPQGVRDVESMYTRTDALAAKLTLLGMQHETNYAPMLERIAGSREIKPLKSLIDYLEPVKEYKRGTFRKYTQQTPLHRAIDAARPESRPARALHAMIDRVIGGKASEADLQKLRDIFTRWQQQEAVIAAQSQHSFLLQELVPVSKDFARLGALGLAALERTQGTGAPPFDEATQAFFRSLADPKPDLLNMAAPAVEKLAKHAAGAR